MITPVVLHEDAFYEYFKPYRHPDACHDIWGGLLRGEVAHVLGDFHRAETRAAHRAEVRDLAGFLGHGFVVEFARLVRAEAEVELVFPEKFEARQCGFCRCFYASKRNY